MLYAASWSSHQSRKMFIVSEIALTQKSKYKDQALKRKKQEINFRLFCGALSGCLTDCISFQMLFLKPHILVY
jgi:hypothetical protein